MFQMVLHLQTLQVLILSGNLCRPMYTLKNGYRNCFQGSGFIMHFVVLTLLVNAPYLSWKYNMRLNMFEKIFLNEVKQMFCNIEFSDSTVNISK